MQWLYNIMNKSASKYRPGDQVRFFVQPLKSKKTKTLRPHYNKGEIKGLDKRRYVIKKEDGTEISIHPRDVTRD